MKNRFRLDTLAAAVRRRGAKRVAALAATGVTAAVAFAGCGSDVPSNSVAKVGDAPIEKSEFDRWLAAAAKSQQPPGAGGEVVAPDPPGFERCIASKEQQAQVPPAEGQQPPPTPSPEELKQQCQQEYDALKGQVMQFLIQAEAIEQEAEERNVELSDAEVQQQFTELKEQSFPNDEDFQKFVEESGRTEEDLLFQVRLDLLSNKIRESVVGAAPEISDADIQKYYEENKERPPIGKPEQRDLEVILTDKEEDAEKALEELEDNAKFAAVAKKYSSDQASRSNGGKLEDVEPGQQEMALDQAVFDAEEGELVGPIETEFGFYVFRVTDVTPAEQQSLEESREAITDILRSQREQEVLNDFIEDFQKKSTEETVCAEDYVVQGCKNGPEPESQPAPGAPPGGAPPQGAPPQGAPPQGVPPQGAPPQGVPPQGAPPQGAPPQGVPPGAPPQGAPPQGVPPQGAPPQGVPPQGVPPQGVPPQGGGPGG